MFSTSIVRMRIVTLLSSSHTVKGKWKHIFSLQSSSNKIGKVEQLFLIYMCIK
jgi:hypothetical protein